MKKQLLEIYKMQKKLEKEINKIVPEVYACFALALYKRGWKPNSIEQLFIETQNEWNENVNSMDDMIKHVADVTGIDVRSAEYDQS